MKHPRWVIPLEPDEVTAESPALIVDISDELKVVLAQRLSNEDILPIAMPSLAAVQLGQALQDASAYVGRLEAKRRDADEVRRKR